MDLSVVFYGTGGSVPTARRATACLLTRMGGDRIMFDCGEGAQRQMHRSTGLVQLDEIYLTHYHADHYLGLPGLLKTYDLQDRKRPLRVVGPGGLRSLFSVLARIFGKLSYDIELVELAEGAAIRNDGYEIRSFPVKHRMRALGYAGLSLEEYVRMRDHGVTPDFVESMKEVGYTQLTAGELVRLRDHGVSASYVRQVKDRIKESPSVEEIIRMRSHGEHSR